MLTLHYIYQYVFGNNATIKDTVFPADKRDQIRNRIANIIRDRFQSILNSPLKIKLRKLLRKLNKVDLETILFENASDALDTTDTIFPSDEEIKARFKIVDGEFQYFRTAREKRLAEQHFIMLFKSCKFTADLIEANNSEDNTVAYTHAYKMLVLFGAKNRKNPFSSADRYLHSFQFLKSTKPIHDALIKEIPVYNGNFKLLAWRKLILCHGPRAVSLFQLAPEINQMLKRDPLTLTEARNTASQLRYQRYDEYPELARLCYSCHVPEPQFNKCLDIIEPRHKKSDRLPDVIINGNAANYPGYYLAKLPHHDPVKYVIGHLTNSCMSIGGASETCIIDGATKENCGFYVLLKSHDNKNAATPFGPDGKINYDQFTIVGCGYAWLGQMDSLTIDSWDNLRPEVDDPVIIALLQRFSMEVTKHSSIRRVTIGTGGKTPKYFASLTHPDIMQEGIQCPDSYKQALIHSEEPRSDAIQTERYEIMQQYQNNSIYSFINTSLFEQIIDLDNTSSSYLSWIRQLFLEKDSRTLWMNLLDRDQQNLNKLIACLKEHGPGYLELLLQIHNMGLLTPKTYNNILGLSTQNMLLRTILAGLKEIDVTIIEPDLFEKMLQLLKNENQLENVGRFSHRLYESRSLTYPRLKNIVENAILTQDANILLTQLQETLPISAHSQITLFVAENLKYIHRIRIMQLAIKYSSVSHEYLASARLCSEYLHDGEKLCAVLTKHLPSDILDYEILQRIVRCEKRIQEIELIISSIQNANILNRANLRLLIDSIAVDNQIFTNVKQALCVMDSIKRLSQSIFSFLMENAPIAHDITCAFLKLHNYNVFNDRNVALINKFPKHAQDIADSLRRLSKKELLNEVSLNIIESQPEHADTFSCGLADIFDAAKYSSMKSKVLADFIDFYQSNKELAKRCTIVMTWVSTYMKKNNMNPFVLLKQEEPMPGGPTLFSGTLKDPVKLFNTFIAGDPIPDELDKIMGESMEYATKVALM